MEEKNVPNEREEIKKVPELDEDIHKRDYEIEDHPQQPQNQTDESVKKMVDTDMEQRRESQRKDGPNNMNVQGTYEK